MGKIVKQSEDFAKWYTSIITNADLIDYGLVKGTIIYKPYGWAIWKKIQNAFNQILINNNTLECCFPLFIPYSEFKKEKEHIEGFNPELFKVENINDKKLEDHLVIRPTSEIAFCHYFQRNVKSYQDLPLILNQWVNVFRVEKNTKPFLRTSEFFWQEQHAVFASKNDAYSFALKMLNEYYDFVKNYLSIATLKGEKTPNERFAGADNTFTIEAFMKDGQAIQCATSHYLGQSFAKSFNIKYQDKNNKLQLVHQTSAGISTRIIGSIIMSHADDFGLVLPFKIAPIQFAIIANKEFQNSEYINTITNLLKNYDYQTFFEKSSIGLIIADNEIKGIPFQIIIGKKEIESKTITIYFRDNQIKKTYLLKEFTKSFIKKMIFKYETNLYTKSQNHLENSIEFVKNLDEFKKAINNKKIALAYWNGTEADEKQLKTLTSATPRCFELDTKIKKDKKCFFTNNKNAKLIYFARAY